MFAFVCNRHRVPLFPKFNKWICPELADQILIVAIRYEPGVYGSNVILFAGRFQVRFRLYSTELPSIRPLHDILQPVERRNTAFESKSKSDGRVECQQLERFRMRCEIEGPFNMKRAPKAHFTSTSTLAPSLPPLPKNTAAMLWLFRCPLYKINHRSLALIQSDLPFLLKRHPSPHHVRRRTMK